MILFSGRGGGGGMLVLLAIAHVLWKWVKVTFSWKRGGMCVGLISNGTCPVQAGESWRCLLFIQGWAAWDNSTRVWINIEPGMTWICLVCSICSLIQAHCTNLYIQPVCQTPSQSECWFSMCALSELQSTSCLVYVSVWRCRWISGSFSWMACDSVLCVCLFVTFSCCWICSAPCQGVSVFFVCDLVELDLFQLSTGKDVLQCLFLCLLRLCRLVEGKQCRLLHSPARILRVTVEVKVLHTYM